MFMVWMYLRITNNLLPIMYILDSVVTAGGPQQLAATV